MFYSSYLFDSLEQLNASLSDGRYVLLVAEKFPFERADIRSGIEFCGGIFTQVIHDEKSYDNKIIAIELDSASSVVLAHDMSKEIDTSFLDQSTSIVIFVDGLSAHIDLFLDNTFEDIHEEASILGGGAGKLTLIQEPVIFDNSGIYQDAALIIHSKLSMGVGVQHGWQELDGPFMVNDCKKNILKEINFLPAFEFYKKIVEKDSGRTFDETNFFDIAKGYPIGIVRYNKEPIVRDPIMTQNNALTLVGSIDQNSVISLLKGDKQNLIDASKIATTLAKENITHKHTTTIVIDCISRFLFLEDDFDKEISSIKASIDSQTPLWGALTLGEIANSKGEHIDFYNKTCVVGAL